MISGHGTIDTAVQAIRKGAYDFITKPFQASRLLLSIKNALAQRELVQENMVLKNKLIEIPFFWGQTPSMSLIKKRLDTFKNSKKRLLIKGEAAVGKEALARKIHLATFSQKSPFIVFDCARTPDEEVDGILYGRERGDFCIEQRGCVEKADGGTLFLKSLDKATPALQSKLVKLLHASSFRRVGGERAFEWKFRVIGSAHSNIETFIKDGAFREDLYFRICVQSLSLPSLSARRLDIGALAESFFSVYTRGKQNVRLSVEALTHLEEYNWPGNFKEFFNALERCLILMPQKGCSPVLIEKEHLPLDIKNATQSTDVLTANKNDFLLLSLREARASFERKYLKAQVSRFGGNIQKTAHFIGMERSALHRKIRFLNLDLNNKTQAKEDM
jgi:two-component system nitrogen regulation response regulator NtrX